MEQKTSRFDTGNHSDLHSEMQKIQDGYAFRTRIMEAISHRGKAASEPQEILDIIQKYREPEIYRELLFCLFHQTFDVSEAQVIWKQIVRHKEILTKQLSRDPGLKVAALDLFENLSNRLKNLKLIEAQKLQSIAQTSLTDSLTSLYNKKTFEKRLESEMRRTHRYKRDLSLILFDIDHFKIFNDTYGHPTGDMLLSRLGQLILENLRESDTAFRYGGEEFAIILVETEKNSAFRYAQRFRQLVEKTNFENLTITISVGCSQMLNRKDTPSSLIQRTDRALYKARQQGRNCVCLL